MNDFDAYVAEFARALPAGRRKDWACEVRADLDAELEGALRDNPGIDAAVLMRRIVENRQDPGELARSVAPAADTLIGRGTYPWYRFTLAIAMVASLLLVAVASLASGGLGRGSALASLSGMATAGVIVFTVVTLVFAAAQRLGVYMPDVVPAGLRWGLPVGRADRAPGNAVLAIALIVVLWLDLAPHTFGLPLLVDEPGLRLTVFPVLSADFETTPRWLLNGWCAFAAAVWLAQRAQGADHAAIRLAWAGVRLAGLAIWIWILVASPVFAVPDAAVLARFPVELAEVMSRTVAPALYQGLRAVLALGWILHATAFFRGLGRTDVSRRSRVGRA